MQIRAIGEADPTSEDSVPEEVSQESFETQAPPPSEDIADALVWEEDDTAPRRAWLAPTLTMMALLGWTGFFAWANRLFTAPVADPAQWAQWIVTWSVPVILIALAWLIAMRSSTREAHRFGNAASLLARESELLENRLISVNRELSLAREFLAAQSRELEFLGRSAVERISGPAEQLREMVGSNGAQIDAIASVSVTALDNMKSLRDNLPVVANSARDASNQIGSAGRIAKANVAELVDGFERLNEFGKASENQVLALREKIDAALTEFDGYSQRIESDAGARLAALKQQTENFHRDLGQREEEALAALGLRGDSLREEIANAWSTREAEEEAALAAMRDRIATLTEEAGKAAEAVRAGERSAIETWEAQITGMRKRMAGIIDEIGRLDAAAIENANAKLRALTKEAEDVDGRLMERDRRFQDQIAERDKSFEEAEAAAIERLRGRMEALDTELARRGEAQESRLNVLTASSEALKEHIAQIDEQIARLAIRGSEAEEALARSSAALAGTVKESETALGETEDALSRLTDASVRVLELIQASAKHSRTELPAALGVFEAHLAEARASAGAAVSMLEQGSATTDALIAAIERLREQSEGVHTGLESINAHLLTNIDSQSETLKGIREQIAAADDESSALAEKIADALRNSIGTLEAAGRNALQAFDPAQSRHIEELAGRIGTESATAIERAIAERTSDTMAQFDTVTAQATETSREAVAQLRDQLARVNELTVNLETRIARAREQAEEQVDSDFSRRVALITESLNSNAIDIAKALSTEVTDTAWASYLRGDRSVFTRRAIRLLDNSESREIAELYDTDHEFRDHVRRYIHDFEAMLRTMLSTRDGNALGVTLLSSDMGKLYVVLAQAIERLRD